MQGAVEAVSREVLPSFRGVFERLPQVQLAEAIHRQSSGIGRFELVENLQHPVTSVRIICARAPLTESYVTDKVLRRRLAAIRAPDKGDEILRAPRSLLVLIEFLEQLHQRSLHTSASRSAILHRNGRMPNDWRMPNLECLAELSRRDESVDIDWEHTATRQIHTHTHTHTHQLVATLDSHT
jgi:hypothetical protein